MGEISREGASWNRVRHCLVASLHSTECAEVMTVGIPGRGARQSSESRTDRRVLPWMTGQTISRESQSLRDRAGSSVSHRASRDARGGFVLSRTSKDFLWDCVDDTRQSDSWLALLNTVIERNRRRKDTVSILQLGTLRMQSREQYIEEAWDHTACRGALRGRDFPSGVFQSVHPDDDLPVMLAPRIVFRLCWWHSR